MKTLKEIELINKTFQDKYGTNIVTAEQGSLEWLQTRLGVITASEVHKAVAKLGTETRNTYMCQLVAEVATGMIEEINSKYMSWGKLNEQAARSAYEFANDCKIEPVNFIFRDDSFREGASLDGLITGTNKFVEIKCPYNPTHFIKFAVQEKTKAENQWQYQFQMRVTGAEVLDFVNYDPRMTIGPLQFLTVEKDLKFQAKFDELIPQFIHDMDMMLAQLGLSYGSQWSRLTVKNTEMVGA